jgi:DNA-binding MarR family transcriptional regulator
MRERLTPEQTRLWRAFRKMNDRLTESINRRLDAATGLSAPEFGVLGMLEELGRGTARQAELLALAGWDRSRLSHLLRRMEARGLVERRPAGGKGVIVSATARGRELQADGTPVQTRALHELFFDRLSAEQARALAGIVERLAEAP